MARKQKERKLSLNVRLTLRPDQLVEFTSRLDALANGYDKDYDYTVRSLETYPPYIGI